jgi:hypothetical protein
MPTFKELFMSITRKYTNVICLLLVKFSKVITPNYDMKEA